MIHPDRRVGPAASSDIADRSASRGLWQPQRIVAEPSRAARDSVVAYPPRYLPPPGLSQSLAVPRYCGSFR